MSSLNIKINQKLPELKLRLNNGDEIKNDYFTGKKAVMYFYPKDDTSGCTTEALEFSKYIKEFSSKNCIVVGISKDSVKSHCNFIAKHSLTVLLATDESDVCEQLGIWQEKSMYGKKYMGIARTTILLNENGEIIKIWEKVKPEGHAAEVLQSL
jgi:thioredoxin-dependent peroxiredoxin